MTNRCVDQCTCGWLKPNAYGSMVVTKQINPRRCAEVRRTSWTANKKTRVGKVKGMSAWVAVLSAT